MKKTVLHLTLVLLLLPVFVFADPVPKDIAKAFADAGLPVLKDRINPIEFSLPLLDGKEQKLSALKGKVVFLNFWATWCGPCRVEMPSMENLHQRFKSRGLEILAVNCQEKNAEVASFMKGNKFTFPAALDVSGSISSRYGVRAIPTTCIIDREGKIIIRIAGSLNWDDPKIIAAFELLLNN
jgi:thiol-disulfide isomerase/thioredoxin